ncbi:MAG: tetratricopeptide repeat protein [Gammaproteobacteria bacterium]|nr:tetratricopeptide repeat protein [Gammaproteobacteria bacterium]
MEHLQHEEEQLERVRQWWEKNGKALIAGVIVAIIAALGAQYWLKEQRNYNETASVEYSRLLQAIEAGDESAPGLAERISQDYGDTVYASYAALLRARMAVENKQWPVAANQLQWLIDNSDESGLIHLARIRLARVMLEQGQAEALLDMLAEVEAEVFVTDYAELRGDAYFELGKPDKAREAYTEALAAASLQRNTRLLQIKLDDLAVGAKDTAQ